MKLATPESSDLRERDCPVCDSSVIQHAYMMEPHAQQVREFDSGPEVMQCMRCSSVFLNPVMTEEAYGDFYNTDSQKNFVQLVMTEDYQGKISENDSRRAEMIKEYLGKTDRLLDIGTGHSNFTKLIPNAVGIDISEQRVAAAQKRGLNVKLCSLYDWNEPVTFVTLFHVLEHIVDPNPFLSKIYDILEPSGALVVEVPNLNDALVGLREYRNFYYQNAHCTYFTPSTLKILLKQNGFTITDEKRLQRYSLDNHLHWLLRKKPGKFESIGLLNNMYSSALKLLGKHDTTLLVCRRGKKC